MKFLISATSTSYSKSNYLVEKYPCLKDYGLEIKEIRRPIRTLINDEQGKPILMESCRYNTYHEAYIDVADLESLLELLRKTDSDLVISRILKDDADFEIEIYDDYRE